MKQFTKMKITEVRRQMVSFPPLMLIDIWGKKIPGTGHVFRFINRVKNHHLMKY